MPCDGANGRPNAEQTAVGGAINTYIHGGFCAGAMLASARFFAFIAKCCMQTQGKSRFLAALEITPANRSHSTGISRFAHKKEVSHAAAQRTRNHHRCKS